jgi:cardiolipin synthase
VKKPHLKKILDGWRKNLHKYSGWELAIFIIGILSFFTMIVVLFIPVGDGPDVFTATSEIPPVSGPQFVRLLSNSLTLPVNTGSPVRILNNGDEFMDSLLKDIDSAQSSINMMTYIWDKGEMSDQIFEHLIPKLKQGVQVRIMLDAVGGFGVSHRKEFREFKDLGGKVEIYHSITIIPWNIAQNHKRNHRRSIVIDGRIGYTGGMAVSDTWLGDARNEKEYRDMMFRTTGNMAESIEGAFAEIWAGDTGELLTGESFFPVPAEDPAADTLTYVSMVSNPASENLAMQKFFLLSVLGGENKIYVSTPYLLPDPAFKEVLISKAKGGADVRILLPNNLNDSKGVRLASQSYYEDLLDGGVKIYEYQPTFIHTKTMVIDGTWSVIGSANIDNRSRKLNEENIIGISDKGFGSSLENVFLDDLTKAKQIDAAEWKKRGLLQRARELFALKFIQQY